MLWTIIRKARNHCQDVGNCGDEDHCQYHLGIDHCRTGICCQDREYCQEWKWTCRLMINTNGLPWNIIDASIQSYHDHNLLLLWVWYIPFAPLSLFCLSSCSVCCLFVSLFFWHGHLCPLTLAPTIKRFVEGHCNDTLEDRSTVASYPGSPLPCEWRRGESLVTTELHLHVNRIQYGYDTSLRVCYNYSHRNVTRTLCTWLSHFFFYLWIPVECATCRTDTEAFGTDTLPESRWQPYKNISPRELWKYSQLLFFLQNMLDFPCLDKACKWALLH